MSSVNAAAQNKPHLVQEQLPSLLPGLLKETVPRKELIREYQMGPWVGTSEGGYLWQGFHSFARVGSQNG